MNNFQKWMIQIKEKYIRVMSATKDDTQRNNLGVKLTKLLKKYNQE